MSLLSVELIKWAVLLFVCLFALVTHKILSGTERFFIQHQQMIADPHFLDADKSWLQNKEESSVSYNGAALSIRHEDPSSTVISQKIPVETPAFVRFSVEAGATDLTPDDRAYAGGSATLRFLLPGNRKPRQVSIFKLTKDSSIRSFTEDIYIEKDVVGAVVLFRLLRSGGQFDIKNPELSLLAEYPQYQKTKTVFIGCWIFLAGLVMYLIFRMLSLKVLLILSVLGGIALVGILSPIGVMNQMNQAVSVLIPEGLLTSVHVFFAERFGIGSLASSPSASVSKIGHMALFFIFGLIFGWNYRTSGLVFGVALLGGLAMVTELLQIFTHGRSSSFVDIFIDLTGGYLGYLTGALCYTVILRYFTRTSRLTH